MDSVLPAVMGQAPDRQAVIFAGLPSSVPCTMINKVCALGMKVIMLAAQNLALGNSEVMVAGGFESMSNVPFYMERGDIRQIDGLVFDGLTDIYNKFHMVNCCENTAKKLNISREEQDAYGTESYRRAAKAYQEGVIQLELFDISIKDKKGVKTVNKDKEFWKVGLDPGIDHFLAMECFDEVSTGGGKVEKFISYCGGLPAPEALGNPLGYKFSWSPRGALKNMLSGAKYLDDGKVVEVSPDGGLLDAVRSMDFLPGFSLEGYPNRDSIAYRELYGIPEATTIIRGKLRYKGYTDIIRGLLRLGMLSPENHPLMHEQGPPMTWRKLMCQMLGVKTDLFYDNLLEHISERVGSEKRMQAIVALGLVSEIQVEKMGSPLNTLSNQLAKVLKYEKGERDLVLMRHQITIRWPDRRREERGINLACYGSDSPDGFTAMAKTVGYPTAIAAKMVLDKEIQKRGMVLPFVKDIYRPMLNRLEAEGIVAQESTKFIS